MKRCNLWVYIRGRKSGLCLVYTMMEEIEVEVGFQVELHKGGHGEY
jgi:hypothetical protein